MPRDLRVSWHLRPLQLAGGALVERFDVFVLTLGDLRVVRVPAGFRPDLRPYRVAGPRGARGAVLHAWLTASRPERVLAIGPPRVWQTIDATADRLWCRKILAAALEAENVPAWRRWALLALVAIRGA